MPRGTAPQPPSAETVRRAKGKAMRKKSENIYAAETARRQSKDLRDYWAKSLPKKGKGKGKGKTSAKGKGKGKYVQKVSPEESRKAAVEKLEKWVVKKRKESINEMVKIDKMLAPKAPKFKAVKTIKPEAKGLNLLLKSIKCEKDESATTPTWKAVLGDATGVVTFSLRSQEHADVCKAGASVRVQNAKVIMMKGSITVVVDKWGVIKEASEPVEASPLESNDISATEYEKA